MISKWTKIKQERLHHYKVVSVRADTAVSPRTGATHTFYVIESPDWINIIPLTADNQVVMIRQYRHGNDEITLEVPGGIIDEGETPQEAAERELREETGYASDDVIPTGTVAPNPALFNNTCHSFLARNARLVGEQEFDGTEDIAIELVPLADIPQLIRTGQISHALTINAFYFLNLLE
ncbi:MAG: NUDIX hydrolase [Chloroflexi bacterium]|nr:NUDIX hydrolase [Chloroflexota bacterium]